MSKQDFKSLIIWDVYNDGHDMIGVFVFFLFFLMATVHQFTRGTPEAQLSKASILHQGKNLYMQAPPLLEEMTR